MITQALGKVLTSSNLIASTSPPISARIGPQKTGKTGFSFFASWLASLVVTASTVRRPRAGPADAPFTGRPGRVPRPPRRQRCALSATAAAARREAAGVIGLGGIVPRGLAVPKQD